MTVQYRKRDRACPHARKRVPALLESAHAALAQRDRARHDMHRGDRARRGARCRLSPRRSMRQQGAGPPDRADRMPCAEARHRRAVRHARCSGGSCATDRTHTGDRRRRAAGGHAVAATRSSDHVARRTGPIVGRARAAGRRTGRRAPQSRHRADRSARHRQIGAVALSRPRSARCLRRAGGRADDRHRCAALHRRIARERRGPCPVHDVRRRGRCRRCPHRARLRSDQSVGRLVRNARRAGVPAPVSATRAQRRPRRRRAARDAGRLRSRGCRAKRRSTRSSPLARQIRPAGRPIPTSMRCWRGSAPISLRARTITVRRSAHRRPAGVQGVVRHGDRRAAGSRLCAGTGEPDPCPARARRGRRLRAAGGHSDAAERRRREDGEPRAALRRQLRRGCAAHRRRGDESHAGAAARAGAGPARSRRLRRLAPSTGPGGLLRSGRQRQAGADPVGRTRSGHTARCGRASRPDPVAQPPHRRRRLRAYRLAARLRTAADRKIRRGCGASQPCRQSCIDYFAASVRPPLYSSLLEAR